MDENKQRNLARIVAVCALILGLGWALYESKNMYHYWVDESPGPDYVMYDRTPLETAGVWIVWLMVDGVVAVLIYFAIAPS